MASIRGRRRKRARAAGASRYRSSPGKVKAAAQQLKLSSRGNVSNGSKRAKATLSVAGVNPTFRQGTMAAVCQ